MLCLVFLVLIKMRSYMISVDLHTHTSYGHGSNTVFEMFLAGQNKGLTIHGFSEHSPRPLGYNYTKEYREHLEKFFPNYVSEVQELVQKHKNVKVLFGLELDWLGKEQAFMQECALAYDYDYLIAGLHFLDTWGFDDQQAHWDKLLESEKFKFYTDYYTAMIKMADSKLFNILAHPDLIKIFSVTSFHKWLPNNLNLVEDALLAAKEADMAMEISSAGLRKPCAEIYPCQPIMEIAAKIQIPISFASDGHCVNTIGYGFDILDDYAKEYGYKECVYFENKQKNIIAF